MNYIGIDIGGTAVKLAVVSSEGKILAKSAIKTRGPRNVDEVIDDIAEAVKELATDYEYESIGVGCPGSIDSRKGLVEYSPNLYWKNVPLAQMLSERMGKKVKVSNDANVAALGEHKFGAGKDYTDTALITLGTGVGGGFVVDGKLFEGFNSKGTEIGHTILRENGFQCTCGRKGCFETYASATALIRETRYAMQKDIDKNSLMWDLCGHDLMKVDGKTAFTAFKKGDVLARAVVEKYVKSLSEGVLDVVNLFRSQAVILGGGICGAGEILTEPVQRRVDKYRYGGPDSLRTVILIAKLGNDAGVIGAASLVME